MLRKLVFALGGAVVAVVAVVALLYITNTTSPLAPIVLAEAQTSARPYVIKIHAQWCPICRGTKGAWEEIVEQYRDKAHLLVLDFTNEETSAAAVAEAQRLKLDRVIEEYYGATGLVVIVDGRTKEMTDVGGFVDASVYAAAIDAVMARQGSGE